MTAKKQCTIAELLQYGSRTIKKKLQHSTTPQLDASLLLAHVVQKNRDELILNRTDVVSADLTEQYHVYIERRCTGIPIAYLTGKKSFWLYNFFVTPAVLIPKSDTELLIEKALELIDTAFKNAPKKTEKSFLVADICTGSGCIAVSLAAQYNKIPKIAEKLTIVATDISSDALAIAQKNAHALLTAKTLSCLHFIQADLLDFSYAAFAQKGGFDLIVSNPPYVPSHIARDLLADGRMEPLLALDGGTDGLSLIRRLIPQAHNALKSGGILLIESGEYNAAQTAELILHKGFTEVQTFTDLSGQPRLTAGIRK